MLSKISKINNGKKSQSHSGSRQNINLTKVESVQIGGFFFWGGGGVEGGGLHIPLRQWSSISAICVVQHILI